MAARHHQGLKYLALGMKLLATGCHRHLNPTNMSHNKHNNVVLAAKSLGMSSCKTYLHPLRSWKNNPHGCGIQMLSQEITSYIQGSDPESPSLHPQSPFFMRQASICRWCRRRLGGSMTLTPGGGLGHRRISRELRCLSEHNPGELQTREARRITNRIV